MKRLVSLIGLTAALGAVFVPANAFADGIFITITETTPTTITIETNLPGNLSSSNTMTLIPGYFNNRAPLLQFEGPNVVTNDTGGALGQYPGLLLVGDSSVGQLNPGYAGTVDNAINWIDPESTPEDPLYDTLDFNGPGPPPVESILLSSENEVPTLGLQDEAICYDDSGSPTDCPIVSYGTVVNAFYDNTWGNGISTFQESGAITITFIDDVAATPGTCHVDDDAFRDCRGCASSPPPAWLSPPVRLSGEFRQVVR